MPYCDCTREFGCAACQKDIAEGLIPGYTVAEIEGVREERARIDREQRKRAYLDLGSDSILSDAEAEELIQKGN